MRALPSCTCTLLLLSLSCGSPGDGTANEPLDPESPDAAIAPQPDAAPGQPDAAPGQPDAQDQGSLADEIEALVTGDYVLQMRVATIQELPFLGSIDTVTTSLGIATIQRSGDTFVLTEQGCHVDSDSGDSVVTTIPDVIPRTTAPAVEELSFWREGAALRWSRAEVAIPIGVLLDDPASDALPTASSDPRVVDQDEDGQPGVTVHVSGLASGAIYVVQRTRVAYEGGLREADGQLVALAVDDSEQNVIGSDNPLLGQNVPTVPNPDASLSTITLVPVDEVFDCDRAVAEADSLFP